MPLCMMGNDHVAASLEFLVLRGIIIHLKRNTKYMASDLTIRAVLVTQCL
jgi:hypothetical protein